LTGATVVERELLRGSSAERQPSASGKNDTIAMALTRLNPINMLLGIVGSM
jgi:hypothetical protein